MIYRSGLVAEVAALGVPHPTLGQGIVVVAAAKNGAKLDVDGLLDTCRQQLPRYMLPEHVSERPALPRGPNGKIDRSLLKQEFLETFTKAAQ